MLLGEGERPRASGMQPAAAQATNGLVLDLRHADTIGLDATNDRLAESCFGNWDYVLRRCPGITMEAASAIAQAIRANSLVEGGAFHLLPPHE